MITSLFPVAILVCVVCLCLFLSIHPFGRKGSVIAVALVIVLFLIGCGIFSYKVGTRMRKDFMVWKPVVTNITLTVAARDTGLVFPTNAVVVNSHVGDGGIDPVWWAVINIPTNSVAAFTASLKTHPVFPTTMDAAADSAKFDWWRPRGILLDHIYGLGPDHNPLVHVLITDDGAPASATRLVWIHCVWF